MKKQNKNNHVTDKKLDFNRETLRRLSRAELESIRGGGEDADRTRTDFP